MSNLGVQREGNDIREGVAGSEVAVDLQFCDLPHDVQGSHEQGVGLDIQHDVRVGEELHGVQTWL